MTAWDDNADSRKEATNENIVLADPVTLDWSRQDALILSPGVPLTHPQPHPAAQAALSAGKPVIGDMELLFENVGDAKLIGITGTNGKSTTSALISTFCTLRVCRCRSEATSAHQYWGWTPSAQTTRSSSSSLPINST